jgi:hypothetical protein
VQCREASPNFGEDVKKTLILFEPVEVAAKLASLDLEVEPLLNVGRTWFLAYSNWTPNHPRTYRGMSAWAESVRKFRESTVPKGWIRSEEGNYPLTVHPSGEHCVAITSGDADTGNPQGNPKNKVPKGPRTADAVEKNSLQLSLPLDDMPAIPTSLIEQAPKARVTRILLIHLDGGTREIRSELSLPLHMNQDGLITSWSDRIILPAIPLDGDPVDFQQPSTPPLDIEIRRRA